jgi:hypothetical protein
VAIARGAGFGGYGQVVVNKLAFDKKFGFDSRADGPEQKFWLLISDKDYFRGDL